MEFSTEGYLRNSPDINQPNNVIPSNKITMKGVDFKVLGTDNRGYTKVTLDLKTIGMIVTFVITITGMYFALQSDIARAMELPEPEISKVEYELKDELIRNTIMDTQEDVEEIKETIKKIDQRLYEMTR